MEATMEATSADLIRGSYIASSMAEALFKAAFPGCNLPKRDKSLISAIRHHQHTRDFAAKMVAQYSAIILESDKEYLVQDAIENIASYKALEKTGMVFSDRAKPYKVEAMLKIRALKNDARKLKRAAYALCQTDFDKESLVFVAMSAPTYLDYQDWARAAA